MNRETKSLQQLNLATLSRLDPAVVEVLGSSGHVAVYRFDDVSKTWHRKDAEGSLFIVKRSEQPLFRIIVLNRLSTDNLVEDIKANLLIQLNGPYLLYRNSVGETNGIWFYEQADRDKISTLIESVKSEIQNLGANTESSNEPRALDLGSTAKDVRHPTAFSVYHQSSPTTSSPTTSLATPPHLFPAQGQANITFDNTHSLTKLTYPQAFITSSHSSSHSSDHNQHTPIAHNFSHSASGGLLLPTDESSPFSKLLSPSSLVAKTLFNTNSAILPLSLSVPVQPNLLHNTPPVSKELLRQALLHLVQDETFINLVYTEYLARLS